jgi:hypothetical protein
MVKWVTVKTSKPHRRRSHTVKSYSMDRTKNAFRIQSHKRRPRRTNAQIKAAKSRKH